MKDDNICRIIVKNNVQFLTMPNGEIIPKQKNILVIQDLTNSRDGLAWARVTVLVKLKNTENA